MYWRKASGYMAFASVLLCAASRVAAQGVGQLPPGPLVHMGPLHDSGASVTGAEEGWFRNTDGTFSILLGYFNRNKKEDLEIPIGPDNQIEPGGPDRGQPTHFMTGRQWGMFTVTVPKDYVSKKLTWTIVANHQPATIPLSIDPVYEVSPFIEASMGNTPPLVKFEPAGRPVQGPGPNPLVATLSTKVSAPLALSVSVADDAKTFPDATEVPTSPVVSVTWSKLRGPGPVAFANAKPPVQKTETDRLSEKAVFNGRAATTATFSEPGEYVLLMVANDWSGEGGRGFQCCWTDIQVRISVGP
jgi:hypothetical protein